jgi:DNA-binding LytR/AlgR family response regulator
MKVLIVEDERPASQKLIRLLEEIEPGIIILDVVGSIAGTINWLEINRQPDLVFMDIQLEDGICFEIFEKCSIKTPVIFTTAYDEYPLKAFKVNSVDYLLKPIVPDELRNAINKFREVHDLKADNSKIESVISQLQPKKKERFLVRIGEHYRSVPVSDINCFFIKGKCSFMNVNEGKIYAIDYSLDKAEQMIDEGMFFRVNRNIIVNFTSIHDIIAYSSNRLKIILDKWKEEDEIIVSRERVNEFKRWIDR